MNVSSIWSLVLATSSVQMSLFQTQFKTEDLKVALRDQESDFGLPSVSVYDYIVVGGGAAGCLIAGRLADAGLKVLLLEKGGDPVPAIMNPLLTSAPYHPAVNDFYNTAPQRQSYQRSGGVGVVSAGIMLGGSGSHNGMIYNRGSPEVYEEWAKLLKDPSFAYDNMLNFYKEYEEMVGFLLAEHEREVYYGTKGPFRVDTNLPSSFGDWFETGRSLGYMAADPNAHLSPSFTTYQTSTRDGLRETSYTAFILRRPHTNLKIQRFSNVQKVLLQDLSAYGVLYLRHRIAQVALSKAEVILTAGAIVSPLLLIRSGIGPAPLLGKAGIPCIVELPGVGSHLVDHTNIALHFKLAAPQIRPLNDSQLVSFLTSYPGGRGITGPIGNQAFIRTSIAPGSGPWPDIWINMGIDIIDSSKVLFDVGLNRPDSRGSLNFNFTALENGETESSKIVRLDLAFYTVPGDMEKMIEGLEFLFFGILATPQFKDRGYNFDGDIREGCELYEPYSKEFWICFVSLRTGSGDHMVATCRMGAETDPLRVVDTEFRVTGVQNLRVADASVMPVIPNANTFAPTLVMAAKAVSAITGN